MLETKSRIPPGVFIIFGGGGDLTWRKLVPSIFNLYRNRWLPDNFAVISVDLKPMSDEDYRAHLRQGVETFSGSGTVSAQDWDPFAGHLSYLHGNFDDPGTFERLSEKLKQIEAEWGKQAEHIYYQATPPALVKKIINGLEAARLIQDRRHNRIVLEKPFGRDLDSARALNKMLLEVFRESQIYRIDHFLGKETVQNILAFRFSNALFEPLWDRRYIDNVQITVAESIGVAHRGRYFDQAGIVRDMIQNHLLQILCLIAMEPMVNFDADEIRNKKMDVLHAIRPIPENRVNEFAIRGQYGPGVIGKIKVPGYRQEPGVSPQSTTATFAAIKLFVDNWRWQDVPFYLRTGKRLPEKLSEVSIQFRPVPHRSFPPSAVDTWQPNRLVIQIQPDEGMILSYQAKQPGPQISLSQVEMRYSYLEKFHQKPPDAYETLLVDVMQGDQTLFMREDEVEAAWSVVMPVINAWEANRPADFPNYQAGTWGPQAAEKLINKDGNRWFVSAGEKKEQKKVQKTK